MRAPCYNYNSLLLHKTERNGQNEEPERSRGETDCFSLVQYGKRPEINTDVTY